MLLEKDTDTKGIAKCPFRKAEYHNPPPTLGLISDSWVVRALAQAPIDEQMRENTIKKFDNACMIVKEKMPFTKMISICELQERHGVTSGTGYKNDKACATFVDFICKEQQD